MAGVRSATRELASIGEQREPPDPPRHFLDIDQFDPTELRAILDTGFAYKNGRRDRPLAGKILAMVFEKPSTRTRVSFEVAMRQLGGETIYLSAADSQLGRGESVADTARVLSRYSTHCDSDRSTHRACATSLRASSKASAITAIASVFRPLPAKMRLPSSPEPRPDANPGSRSR